MFGGRPGGYAKLVSANRDAAVEEMIAQAASAVPNAIVMTRFDSGEFAAGRGQAMNEVVAYGTAVVLEKATPRGTSGVRVGNPKADPRGICNRACPRQSACE